MQNTKIQANSKSENIIAMLLAMIGFYLCKSIAFSIKMCYNTVEKV